MSSRIVFRSILLLLAVYILTFKAEMLPAQTVSQTDLDFTPALGFQSSYAHTSFRGWGTMENTSQFFLNVHFSHSSFDLAITTAEFSSELIIAGIVRYPNDGLNGPKEQLRGFGFTPVRITLPFSNNSNRFYFSSSAGVFITERAFPNQHGTRLNYMLDAGLGYQFEIFRNRLIQFGYKLHHLSNGNTAMENPGIDSHMFFIAYRIAL